MRIARRMDDQSLLGRSIEGKIIEAREPALVDLPLPLPTIPVVSPLLSPIIDGQQPNPSSGAPAPTKTSPNPTDSAIANANPPPTATAGGSSDGGTGNSGGTSASSFASSLSAIASPSAGNALSSSPIASPSASNVGIMNNDGTSSDGSSVPNSGDISSSPSGSSGATGAGSTRSHSIAGADNSNPTNSVAGGTSGVPSDNNHSKNQHGLSIGGIVGIVILFIILSLLLLVFLLRRRSRARRDDQRNKRNKRWLTKKRTSQFYKDRISWEVISPNFRAAPSNFDVAVPDDHSTSHRINEIDCATQSPPPMAEIRRVNSIGSTLEVENVGQPGSRSSASTASHNSKRFRFLAIMNEQSSLNSEGMTSMSFRPISPSEPFAFSPLEAVGDGSSVYSTTPSDPFAFQDPTNGIGDRYSYSSTISSAAPVDNPIIKVIDVPIVKGISAYLTSMTEADAQVPPIDSCESLTSLSPPPVSAVRNSVYTSAPTLHPLPPIGASLMVTDPFADDNPFDNPFAAQSHA